MAPAVHPSAVQVTILLSDSRRALGAGLSVEDEPIGAGGHELRVQERVKAVGIAGLFGLRPGVDLLVERGHEGRCIDAGEYAAGKAG